MQYGAKGNYMSGDYIVVEITINKGFFNREFIIKHKVKESFVCGKHESLLFV